MTSSHGLSNTVLITPELDAFTNLSSASLDVSASKRNIRESYHISCLTVVHSHIFFVESFLGVLG